MWNALTGLTFVGLRFAWISNENKLVELFSQASVKSSDQTYEFSKYLWSYLDLRDAVLSIEQVAVSNFQGVDVFNVAAPQIFVNKPTQELIYKYFPECEIKKELEAFRSPISSEKFISKFGYRPKFLFDVSRNAMIDTDNF